MQMHNPVSLIFDSDDPVDIVDWLDNNATAKLTISNFVGWIKNFFQMNIEITLTAPPYSSYNYAFVTNDSGYLGFYYIVDYEELGNSQWAYKLRLDTITSFCGIKTNPHIDIYTKPSLVMREHKDRFDLSNNKVLFDRFIESNNNTKPEWKGGSLIDSITMSRLRLVYRNRAFDWKPAVYLYAETPFSVTVVNEDMIRTVYEVGVGGSNVRTYAIEGDYYHTTGSGNPSNLVTDNWSLYYHLVVDSGDTLCYHQWIYRINKVTGALVANVFPAYMCNYDHKIKVGDQSVNKLYHFTYDTSGGYPAWTIITGNNFPMNNIAGGIQYLPDWDDIDAYDPKNERIVEIPYASAATLNALSPKSDSFGIYLELEQMIEESLQKEINTKSLFYTPSTFDLSGTDKAKVKHNDPKLFTSQFAPLFFVMNGMAIGLKKEHLYSNDFNPTSEFVNLKWGVGLAQANQFYLHFTGLNFSEYIKEEIDETVKRWTVNNEVASFKDEAYTYNQYYKDLDDRSRRITEEAANRNMKLQAVSQITGIAGGAFGLGAAKNPGIAALQLGSRAVSAGINIYQGIKDYQDFMAQQEIKYKQKYLDLELSVTNVAGANIDFLRKQNIDKVRFIEFGLSERDMDFWDMHFHKFGYQTMEYKIPNLITRKYWNYIQMIPELIETPAWITEEMKLDIIERFQNGITFFHTDQAVVDWNQEKENWER